MNLVEPPGEPFLRIDGDRSTLAATVVEGRPLLALATRYLADDPALPGYDAVTRYGERPLRDHIEFLDAGDATVVGRIDLGWWREHSGTLDFRIAGDVLIGGFEYQEIRAWAIPSGELIATTKSRGHWHAIDTASDGVVVAVGDTVRQIDPFTGRESGPRRKQNRWRKGDRLWAVATTGPHVLAGTEYGDLWIWDGATRRTVIRTAHRGPIVAMAAYQGFAATSGTDMTVKLWDVERGELVGMVASFREEPPSVAFTDGELLVGGDLRLLSFDPRTGAAQGIRAAFTPDDPAFVPGGDDNEYAEFITIGNATAVGGSLYFTTPKAVWRLPARG